VAFQSEGSVVLTRARHLATERGFALVFALGLTVVSSMMVVTVIELARSNQRNSSLSGGRAAAYDLADAGVNNAMSVLRLPSNNALDKYVFCAESSSLPTLPCQHTDTYVGGKVVWYGTLYQNPAAGTAIV
jgi:Tfp pilus assembly protein PilX